MASGGACMSLYRDMGAEPPAGVQEAEPSMGAQGGEAPPPLSSVAFEAPAE